MKQSLREKCELLAENYTVINKDFKWEFEIMTIVAANTYTNAGMKADPEKMKECREILKKKKGIFSDLRGISELAILSKMAIDEDPEGFLDDVIAVFDKVCAGRVFTSSYMVLCALIICDQHKVEQADEVIEKMKDIMEKMKKEHPLLTASEDMPLATVMALMSEDTEKQISEMEECYDILKRKFPFHNDAVQGLCQVLCLSGSGTEEKCAKAEKIFDALKKKGVKYGKDTELAALGALVDLDMEPEDIAEEIREVSDLLQAHKGFGNITLGKEYRAMFAALLVAQEYSSEVVSSDATSIGSALALIIAEEIVMLILIASTTAATSATN
ncbi:MAG: DUF4003 family protein [Lachnospiraceae bacterium]|nr:DUF4003 family protein [Lachnospiraceae bacterium]MBR6157278.1 DUF4003 family protein [Lachnospiraceae bacterium]MBR6849352.1 DUF4003 family protein [Lachnospiraceae bacterium]